MASVFGPVSHNLRVRARDPGRRADQLGRVAEVKGLNQAVKRNSERFPQDFMFQLTTEEAEHLRSQSVTSRFWGGRRTLSYVELIELL